MRRALLSFALASACALPALAFALPEVFQAAGPSGPIMCGAVRAGYEAGALKKARGPLTVRNFSTYKALAKKAKSDAAKTSGSKRKKLVKRASSYTAMAKQLNPFCTVAPTPTPTPTPTPGAPGEELYFDAAGNLTAYGKAQLGVPATLEANITRGRTAQDGYCTGCHIERTFYAFPVLRERIAQPPMFYDSSRVPDQTLADLVAYLNRFRI